MAATAEQLKLAKKLREFLREKKINFQPVRYQKVHKGGGGETYHSIYCRYDCTDGKSDALREDGIKKMFADELGVSDDSIYFFPYGGGYSSLATGYMFIRLEYVIR